MSLFQTSRFRSCGMAAAAACLLTCLVARGQEERRPRTDLKEPVYRVSNLPQDVRQPAHPLDPALKMARECLEVIRRDVRDYSCIIVKRERVNQVLNEPEYMYTEVRSAQVQNGRVTVPFSVYMRFLKPAKVKGREVIYVAGRNNNKLVAHEASNFLKVMPPVWLKPDGPIAMRGQLYPITDIGIENLITKLLEKGQRDRQRNECEVRFIKEGAALNGRPCTVLEVKHPVERSYFDFHIARIFIDQEMNLPVRYAAYGWPARPGAAPELLEEYTYLDVKLNVGLSDKDFDHKSKFR